MYDFLHFKAELHDQRSSLKKDKHCWRLMAVGCGESCVVLSRVTILLWMIPHPCARGLH